jgi:hypothetical protein
MTFSFLVFPFLFSFSVSVAHFLPPLLSFLVSLLFFYFFIYFTRISFNISVSLSLSVYYSYPYSYLLFIFLLFLSFTILRRGIETGIIFKTATFYDVSPCSLDQVDTWRRQCASQKRSLPRDYTALYLGMMLSSYSKPWESELSLRNKFYF